MAQWERQFGEMALIRGEQYAFGGNVLSISWRDDYQHFNALVKGNNTYHVAGIYKTDNTVSKLKCDCPWANKGHRCKHMAAVLYVIDDGDLNVVHDRAEKYLSNNFFSDFKEQIAQKNLFVDPLKIISDTKFPADSYQTAEILRKNLEDTNHNFDTQNDIYEFTITFKGKTNSFNTRILFNEIHIINAWC